MSEFLEIEQKFDVDTGFERPSFGGLAGVSADAPVLYHLSATYFDTADRRLAPRKITLPRRAGGGGAPAARTRGGTSSCPRVPAHGGRCTRRSARPSGRSRRSSPRGWPTS